MIDLLALVLLLATLVGQQPESVHSPDQPASSGVLQPGAGVTAPRLLRDVKPNYTGEAIRARIQGRVTMECVVEPDGTVGVVRVIRSLDSVYGLDDEAIRTVKQWRFVPGMKDGAPVRVAIHVEMSFTLRDQPAGPTTPAPSALAPVSWPESFIDRSTPTEALAPDWLDDSVQTESFYGHFAYPPGWRILKSTDNRRLVTLHADDALGNRTITISEDSRPAPVLLGAPLPQAKLDEFFSGMSASTGARGVQLIGSGQMLRPGGLWVWFEMAASTIDAPNAPPAVAEYLRTSNSGIHVWSFTTTVNERVVNVFCGVLHRASATAADKQEDVRRAGLEFGAVLRLLSIQPR
jgi:TonB family protein